MVVSVCMCNILMLFFLNDDVLCYCVCLVLVVKGVIFDFVLVDLQNLFEDLIDFNLYYLVLILVECELVLYVVLVVSEYLDECYLYLLLMLVDLLLCVCICLVMLCIEYDWVLQVQVIQLGNKIQVEVGCKCLKELLIVLLLLFKVSKFFFNLEMSLVDCVMVLIIWCLQLLDVLLLKDGKVIEDYGNCIFCYLGFVCSLIEQEKKLCDLLV